MSIFKLRITDDLGFEVWQDIEGYEGIYQVSTYGRVRSIERTRNVGKNNKQEQKLSEKVLKPNIRRGYIVVLLSKNAVKKPYSVHRLVALTFLLKLSSDLVQVNHKDENKLNNRVDNLEWCTHKYNCNYGTRNQRTGEKLSKPVSQYSKGGMFVKFFESIASANIETNAGIGNIWMCCVGRRKTAGGYIWKFA